ncbi:MAG: tRNA epoxyqueuosine(34) reductase QueG [Bacteriovoracaceae bacterium]|nr:tRNA epoxyqueuosine(34) reductase QueG [Bacteriovoracaceae bacterium]
MNFTPDLLKSYHIVDYGYTEEPKALSFEHFEKWVEKGEHGDLSYLEDHRKDKRKDLKNYFPKFQSALVFLFSYQETKAWLHKNPLVHGLKIAGYALGFKGKDYHLVIKKSLEEIAQKLKSENPHLEVGLTLDIHPVLERDLAFRAGLGWFGKNSMLIHREHGSYMMIGSLLLSETLPEFQTPVLETDHCGTCRKCIDACPTEAIDEKNRTIVAYKCIGNYTVEVFKEEIPPLGYEKGNYFFGCDICQEVCPWNKEEKTGEHSSVLYDFFNRPLMHIQSEVESMTKRGFKKKFAETSLERLGKEGLLKNLKPFLLRPSSALPPVPEDDGADV